jgi:hypothetical protein
VLVLNVVINFTFSFQNQIRAHQEMLTDLLGANTVKTITLKGVREGIQQLQQCLSVQEKNNVNTSIYNGYTVQLV